MTCTVFNYSKFWRKTRSVEDKEAAEPEPQPVGPGGLGAMQLGLPSLLGDGGEQG